MPTVTAIDIPKIIFWNKEALSSSEVFLNHFECWSHLQILESIWSHLFKYTVSMRKVNCWIDLSANFGP